MLTCVAAVPAVASVASVPGCAAPARSSRLALCKAHARHWVRIWQEGRFAAGRPCQGHVELHEHASRGSSAVQSSPSRGARSMAGTLVTDPAQQSPCGGPQRTGATFFLTTIHMRDEGILGGAKAVGLGKRRPTEQRGCR